MCSFGLNLKFTSLRTNGKPYLYLKFKFLTSIEVSSLGHDYGNYFFISYLVSNSPSCGKFPYSISLSTLAISPLKLTAVNTNYVNTKLIENE